MVYMRQLYISYHKQDRRRNALRPTQIVNVEFPLTLISNLDNKRVGSLIMAERWGILCNF